MAAVPPRSPSLGSTDCRGQPLASQPPAWHWLLEHWKQNRANFFLILSITLQPSAWRGLDTVTPPERALRRCGCTGAGKQRLRCVWAPADNHTGNRILTRTDILHDPEWLSLCKLKKGVTSLRWVRAALHL